MCKNGLVPVKHCLKKPVGRIVKLEPQERWKKNVRERFAALKVSNEFERLRQRGLDVLGRKRLLTPEEWWTVLGKVWSSPEYGEWHQECRRLGDRFGLAPWTIEMACLLKDYTLDTQPHVAAVQWPQIGVVTDCTDQVFLEWLCYEAQRLNLHIYQREGSSDHRTGRIGYGSPPLTPLTASSKPPRHKAFMMRVDIPVDFPPEAARNLQKSASDLGRELLERLGYRVWRRQRGSKLMSRAVELRAGEPELASGEIYDIIDGIYGEYGPMTDDQQRRELIKSQRKKVRRRLKDRYEFKA